MTPNLASFYWVCLSCKRFRDMVEGNVNHFGWEQMGLVHFCLIFRYLVVIKIVTLTYSKKYKKKELKNETHIIIGKLCSDRVPYNKSNKSSPIILESPQKNSLSDSQVSQPNKHLVPHKTKNVESALLLFQKVESTTKKI